MCDPAQYDEPILFEEAVMRLQTYGAGIYANRAGNPGAVKQILGACILFSLFPEEDRFGGPPFFVNAPAYPSVP